MRTPNTMSIFLVEDDTTYASALVQYLGKLLQTDVRIETFSDGERCVDRIRQQPEEAADVVILDYYLSPDSGTMNGIDVLRKIKEINSKITVVILSAQDKLEIAAESIKYGAYEYIVKSESAFVRTYNIIKNLTGNMSVERKSNIYERWSLGMAVAIVVLIILDIIYYMTK